MALLRKVTRNLRHPKSLHHPVSWYRALSSQVIFRKRALWIVALLQKMTWHPISLHHPVSLCRAAHKNTHAHMKLSVLYGVFLEILTGYIHYKYIKYIEELTWFIRYMSSIHPRTHKHNIQIHFYTQQHTRTHYHLCFRQHIESIYAGHTCL